MASPTVQVQGIVCNCVPGEDIRFEMEEIKEREVDHGDGRFTNYFGCHQCGHIVAVVFKAVNVPRPGVKSIQGLTNEPPPVDPEPERLMTRRERRAMRKMRRKMEKKGIEWSK